MGATCLPVQGNFAPRAVCAILLAPVGGGPITILTINKLFIVAEQDRLAQRVRTLHKNSADPKELKIYPGAAHAQHLFQGVDAEDLRNTILDFLSNDSSNQTD